MHTCLHSYMLPYPAYILPNTLKALHTCLHSYMLQYPAYILPNTPSHISTLFSSTGSPLSVIHHLGLGVWSFLASPAQGLKESTQGGGLNLPRLLDGLLEGCSSLASNVALAVSTATSKTTETARRGLISLGLDKLEATGCHTVLPRTLSLFNLDFRLPIPCLCMLALLGVCFSLTCCYSALLDLVSLPKSHHAQPPVIMLQSISSQTITKYKT